MKKIYISAIFITFLIHFFVVNNSAADTTTPYCPSSGNAVIAPAFNQTTGYCVTRPIDSYNTCPDGYTYSMDYKTCVSLPLCPGTSIWDASKKQCQAFSPTSSSSSWISIPDNSCAVDSNGDGEVQQNEIFACTQTPQGYICPQGQARCTLATDVVVPIGGSMGKVRSCGDNCIEVVLGIEGDNYWGGNCKLYEFYYDLQIKRPDLIVSATIVRAKWDDWMQLIFNNNLVWYGPYAWTDPNSFPPPGKCELKTSWDQTLNVDVTSYYKNVSPGSILRTKGRVAVAGKGEGYAIVRIRTGYNCPLGNYPCMQVNNQWMCSSNQCITQSQLEDEGDIIPSGLDDDGPRDSDGNCLGTVLIFNGKGMRCHKAGVKTGFHNCCDESKGKIYDSMGSTGLGTLTDSVKLISGIYEATTLGAQLAQTTHIEVLRNGDIVLDGINNGFHAILPAGSAQANAVQAALKSSSGVSSAGQAGTVVTNADAFTGTGMANFLKQSGLASAAVSLATSMAISDPTLSASVNLAAQSVLWAAGVGGPTAFAAAALQIGMTLVMANCDKQDIMTSTFNDSGFCHYVGSWCMKKWPLVGCVQRAKGYCCFNSKLARIIQEQGRPQLNTFGVDGAWGSPKHPSCRGFTPDEFQSLDFNKIDLSEYVGDIQKNIRQNIQGNVQQIFNQSIQQLTR